MECYLEKHNKKRIILKKLILASLFLSSTLFSQELTLEKVKEIASKASLELNSKIKKGLKKAKRKNGTEGMGNFCIDDSTKILENLNKKLGSKVIVKRVSLNNRNKDAKALENEVAILKAFELIQQSDAYQPKQIVQIVDDNTYKVYSPIAMKSRDCKKCHGLEKKVDKELKKRFSKTYKNENGYGYKSGEIRGAVVVTVSK